MLFCEEIIAHAIKKSEALSLHFNNELKSFFMKKQFIIVFSFLLAFNLSGCSVVEGIFKAGMIWGIMLVVFVVIGIIYLISKGRRK
jgi:hypothetical protein